MARYLDKSKFDVRVVSPANHFLFTPLLPSTAVGTLEFRAVQEPVRTIKGLGKYHQAKAQKLDVENRVVNCRDIFSGDTFDINYDFLVISAGCKTNTFAVPGVTQEQQSTVFFLKHLYHARRIRDRILECFERAASPVASEEERRDLLHFVVVGGGATSCEFATELSEFLEKDVRNCVEINQCDGCTRQFFSKSFLGDDAAVLALSSGEEPASPRHRAGVASMAWRTTRRFSTNAP